MKSDLRFSSTLTWNNFPLPEVDEPTRDAMIEAGNQIAEVRSRYPERALVQLYKPLAMHPDLVKAHDNLDRVVDHALGAQRRLASERQRLELLFASYDALSGGPNERL